MFGKIFFRGKVILFPRNILNAFPPHTDSVEFFDLFVRQYSARFSRIYKPLRVQPSAERIPFFGDIPLFNFEIAVRFIIAFRYRIHIFPRSRKRIVKPVKQLSAFFNFVVNAEIFHRDFIPFASRTVICGCHLHFVFNRTDTVQVFNIQNDIENYGICFLACR